MLIDTNTKLWMQQIQLNNKKLTIPARLYGSLLYKLNLRILHIEDTPVEAIEEHTFLGVNNTLNEIYLKNTSLIEFPSAAFKVRVSKYL